MSPFRQAWSQMKQRCRNPRYHNWDNYGGRGITYAPAWEFFVNFCRDMELTWAPGLMLDRIDNEGNYTPENCRWVTKQVSGQNRRCVVLTMEKAAEIRRLWASGKHLQKEIGAMFGVTRQTVTHIVANRQWRST